MNDDDFVVDYRCCRCVVLVVVALAWLPGYKSVIFEHLAFQDVEDAREYIEEHPLLLTEETVNYIQLWLNRAWGRGEVHKFVSYVPHMKFLVSCQKNGTETIRGSKMMDEIQAQMNAVASPGWQRALDMLEELPADWESAISPEEVDEDLVEAMEQIIELLRPLSVDEETLALQDEIVHMLNQMLEQKDK